jgi:predicted dehydrogenase
VADDRIRIAVVGTGFGARIQVPGFRLSGRFDVVALVGRRPERLRAAAARTEVPRTCASLAEALEIPGLEAVSVTTPPVAHAELAIAAARAGKHVLCEKPMARDRGEAAAMLAAATEAGVIGLVDHEFRFDPARAMLGRLVRDGTLGTPRLVTSAANMPHFIDPWRTPPAWWFDADAGGGWLGACGSHAIDAIRAWLGEFTAVTALVDATAPHPPGIQTPADDTFSMLFRLASGAQGVLQQSAATWGPRFEAMRVAGSAATAWIDADGTLWLARADAPPAHVPIPAELNLPAVTPPAWSGPFAAKELPTFIRQAHRFADLIRGNTIPDDPKPATFADGLAVQHVMDAARESSRTCTWIKLT